MIKIVKSLFLDNVQMFLLNLSLVTIVRWLLTYIKTDFEILIYGQTRFSDLAGVGSGSLTDSIPSGSGSLLKKIITAM